MSYKTPRTPPRSRPAATDDKNDKTNAGRSQGLGEVLASASGPNAEYLHAIGKFVTKSVDNMRALNDQQAAAEQKLKTISTNQTGFQAETRLKLTQVDESIEKLGTDMNTLDKKILNVNDNVKTVDHKVGQMLTRQDQQTKDLLSEIGRMMGRSPVPPYDDLGPRHPSSDMEVDPDHADQETEEAHQQKRLDEALKLLQWKDWHDGRGGSDPYDGQNPFERPDGMQTGALPSKSHIHNLLEDQDQNKKTPPAPVNPSAPDGTAGVSEVTPMMREMRLFQSQLQQLQKRWGVWRGDGDAGDKVKGKERG